MALISVVVPAYNSAATIEATLQSVINQTCSDFECIVVDDCSTDNTLEIVENIALRDPRVRAVKAPENGKVARTRNLGISTASGEYVATLDSDDLWHPRKLELQLAAISQLGRRGGFVYCPNRRIDRHGNVIDSSPYTGYFGDCFEIAVVYNFVGTGSAPLFSRAALEQVGGYCESLAVNGVEDALIQIKVAENWHVAAVDQYLVGYRLSDGSVSSNSIRMLDQRLNMLEIVRQQCERADDEVIALARACTLGQKAMRELSRLRFGDAFSSSRSALAVDWFAGAVSMAEFSSRKLGAAVDKARRGSRQTPFHHMDPKEGVAAAAAAAENVRVRLLKRRRNGCASGG